MPKLYSSRLIAKILKKRGFFIVGTKGSHAKFRKEGKTETNVIVPMQRKEMPQGTFHSILRQSGLKEEDFKN